jgi:catechol 2,3-dioxygenase-like lactoylglutathione lyase family enzyme
MSSFSRRQTLKYTSAFALAATTGLSLSARAQEDDTFPEPKDSPSNPLNVKGYIYTIVTPDMDASIHFYRDIMGFELVGRGKLAGPLPKLPGVGAPGRDYAFIRTLAPGRKNGMLRLMQAPAGARAARPRPGSTIMDPGFAVIECMSRNVDDSYDWLVKNGVETISPPEYYFYNEEMPGIQGSPPEAPFEFRSYSAYGPAGEQMFISSGVSRNGKPWPAWKLPGMHDGYGAHVLISRDRWPLWEFYDAVFAIKPTRDTYTGQESVNTLIGAKKGSSFQFGMFGEGVTMEWWEYRDRAPTPTPAFPTDLDRTGYAMATMLVKDLGQIRARAKAAKVPILAEGALPTPEMPTQEGFFIRGPLGELIEVIGQTV